MTKFIRKKKTDLRTFINDVTQIGKEGSGFVTQRQGYSGVREGIRKGIKKHKLA